MKKGNFYIIFRAFLFISILFSFENTYSSEQKKILVINSYNLGYSWTDFQLQGITGYLRNYPQIDILVEFMDTRRHLDREQYPEYFESLLQKYRNNLPNLILVNDNDALDLVLEYRKGTIFEKLPLVFTGISNLNDYDFEAENVYGIYEKPGIEYILVNIQKIFSDVDTIYFITDNSTSGKVYAQQIENARQSFPDLKLITKLDLSLDSLENIDSKISPNSIIYYVGVSEDAEGNKIDSKTFVLKLLANTSKPVFSNLVTEMDGIIGGEHNSGVFHGEAAGILAVKLLRGEIPLYRVDTPKIERVFNYKLLEKFNIDPKTLGDGVRFINKPESFYEKYKSLIIINFAFLVLLILIIVLLIRYNIIQRKYRSSLILARDNAMMSDKLKSAFLANVSHEFRTPLNAIVGFSDIIRLENKDESLDMYIELVHSNGELLTQIINDVLDLSMIDSQQLKLVCKPVNMAVVFEKLHQQISKLLVDKYKGNVELVLEKKPTLSKAFMGDELRISQLMLSLLQNATKFTEQGYISFGYTEVDYAFVKSLFKDVVHNAETVSYVYITVKDTGIGIPEHMTKKVFDRFVRVKSDVVDNIQGTGLGLSICKALVTLMSGEIGVKSIEGNGTEFYFYLPIRNI
jgi:signal transduction histidine kinase